MRATETEIDIEMDLGDIVTRGEDWGGQLVRHITLPAGTDFTPLFQGLPGDVAEARARSEEHTSELQSHA